MKEVKDYTIKILYGILVSLFLWMSVTSTIQAFKCSGMTQTQLFLHIPKSFVCDWNNCN
jgi:hypothetical protein